MPVIVDRTGTRKIVCDGCHEPLSEEPSDQFVTLLSKDHSYSFHAMRCLDRWVRRFDG